MTPSQRSLHVSGIHRTPVINHRQEGFSHADMRESRGDIFFWPLSVCGRAGGSRVPRPDYGILCLVGLLPRCSRLTEDEALNQSQQQSKANGLHLSIRPVGSLRAGPPQCCFIRFQCWWKLRIMKMWVCCVGIFSWWLDSLLVTVQLQTLNWSKPSKTGLRETDSPEGPSSNLVPKIEPFTRVQKDKGYKEGVGILRQRQSLQGFYSNI